MTDQLLDYEQLFATLARHGVRFVVVGGLAVNAHGVIRATQDADIVPAPEHGNLSALARALKELEAHVPGADPAPDPLSPEVLSSGVTVKCETRFGPLHIIQGQPGQPAYAELSDQAFEVEVGGLRLQICSYEHLVAMKRAAGRPQDEIDLADLRTARGEDPE